MSSVRQIQPHQSVMWSHKGLVHLQVGRTAAQALHIDTPLLRVEMESLQCSLLARQFHGVNVLVSSIVSCSGVSLGVLVGHGRAQGVEDSAGGDVLGGNQDDGLALAFDFLLLH